VGPYAGGAMEEKDAQKPGWQKTGFQMPRNPVGKKPGFDLLASPETRLAKNRVS